MKLRLLLVGVLALGSDGAQIAVQNQGYVPFSEEPINYRSTPLHDPVAKLQARLDCGDVTLDYQPGTGYLKSILDLLHIPVSSQALVFSKTSFQYKKISPETPRALYYNDDVYVGQVHNGKAIEFVSFDPTQGAIFYLLEERRVEKPVIQRAELDCTQCHIAAGTRNVPGVLVRSVAPGSPSYTTGHESPLRERFGGWYVTGEYNGAPHMGAAVADLSERFDTSGYLTPHSDIVGQLVLAHQTQLHNLITQTNYQTRIALYKGADATRWDKPAEELVRYLLFADEAPFDGPIRGDSGFAQEFAARGPRDPKGRSLRDFDLRTRIFKYPCSYLIYSDAFDSLPEPARAYVYHRLFEVLTGRDSSPVFAKISAEDRKAVLEILLATKQGLPEEWKQSGKERN